MCVVSESNRLNTRSRRGTRKRLNRWLLLLALPAIPAMMPLQPGPMIPAPPIIVHVHPGGGAKSSSFRGVAVNVSFSAKDQMRTARRLIRSGHLTKALQIYQRVLTTYGDHLIDVGHGRYISIRDYVWRTLYRSPVIKNGLYNQIFGLEARKAIDAARTTGHTDAVISACDRYLLASSSIKTLLHVSDRFFEAGYFSRALDINRRLLPNPAADDHRAALLFRSAVAARAAGRPRLAIQYARELQTQYASASGEVAGRMQNLARALARVLKQIPSRKVINNYYLANITPQEKMRSFGAAPNTVLWNHPVKSLVFRMPSNAVASQNMVNSVSMALGVFGLNTNQLQSAENVSQLMYMFPRIRRRVLYTDNLDQIQALNINSGYARWKYPHHVMPSNAQSIANLAFLAQGADQIYCAVRRDRVFGLMTRHLPVASTGSPYVVNPMFTYMSTPPAFRVVCLRAADGSLIWRRSSGGLAGVAVGSPQVTAHGVFLLTADRRGAALQARLSLVKLNQRTGKVEWIRYLCTISGQAFQNPNLNIAWAAGHDLLYIATNAGADMAVRQRSGRICWLHLTVDPMPVSNNPFGYGSPVFRVLPWKLNPPVITQRRLITAVSGQHHIWRINVYRRRTGQSLLSFSPSDKYGPNIFAGVVNNEIILAGTRTTAWSEKTGKLIWKSPAGGWHLVARPTLSRQTIYLPTRRALIGESLQTGRVSLRQPWPVDQAGHPGKPGNLLAGRHQLIAVNGAAIYSYARWKNALAYLNTRIRQAPENARNYLTLAEAAYASGHFGLCQSALQKSLATAQKVSAHRSVFNILFRAAMNFAARTQADAKIKPDYTAFFYSVAASAASTPRRQAAWRFAQLQYWLHRHHPRRAMALCQQILLSRALRNAPLVVDGNALPAKAVLPPLVQLRIINPYGKAIYKKWSDQANVRIASAADSVTQLADVAYGYPNSSAAPIAAKALLHLLIKKQKWASVCNSALLALSDVPRGVRGCEAKLALADALLHLQQYHQAYVVARNTLMCPHLTPNEKGELTRMVTSARRHLTHVAPQMAFTSKSSFSISPPVRGQLLVPAQQQLRWSSRKGVLIVTHHGTLLRWMRPSGHLAPWRVPLGGADGHVALLANHQSVSVLVTPQNILAVNTRTGVLLWRSNFQNLSHGPDHLSLHGYAVVNNPIEPFIAPSANNTVYINGIMQNAPSTGGAARIFPLMARVERCTGPTRFTFVRWTRHGLLVDVRHHVVLVDPSTGKWLWPHPIDNKNIDRLTGVRSVGASIVLTFGTHIHRLMAVDANRGQVQVKLSLTTAAGYRRILTGPDATFFLVGHRRTTAYRFSRDKLRLAWSRKTANPLPQLATDTFTGVAQFQRDGIECLNAATGSTRWQIVTLPGAISGIAGKDMDLRVFDDTLIARTPSDLTAYSVVSGHIRWRAEIMTRETPPLVRMRLADPDLALLACGPTNATNRSEKLILINQRDRHGHLDNGAIVLSKPLVISANDGNGPTIQSWYVLNNSIIFSLHGRLFTYHADR